MRGILVLLLLLGPVASWAGYIKFHKDGFVRQDIERLERQIRGLMEQGEYRVVIDLDSEGGDISGLLGRINSVETGLATRIRQLKADGLRLVTFVGKRANCQSACTALFALGDARQAAPNATFMFHGIGIKKAKKKTKEYRRLYAERWLDVIAEVDYGLAEHLDDTNRFMSQRGDWTLSAKGLDRRFPNFITHLK